MSNKKMNTILEGLSGKEKVDEGNNDAQGLKRVYEDFDKRYGMLDEFFERTLSKFEDLVDSIEDGNSIDKSAVNDIQKNVKNCIVTYNKFFGDIMDFESLLNGLLDEKTLSRYIKR